MTISIIIPVLNEAENIEKLLNRLKILAGDEIHEIIVVDGGSTDETRKIAKQCGVIILESPEKDRSVQMNYGASKASGEIFYFVHGDTMPPDTFLEDIKSALDEGFPVGCFRYQFNSSRKLLRINAYFTRFDKIWCRGGDQSLYIRHSVFREMNGFREDYQIMEDFDFIIRVRKKYSFKIIPRDMIVSARKYDNNSYLRVQIANLIVFNMFRFGFSQNALVKMYQRLLDYR